MLNFTKSAYIFNFFEKVGKNSNFPKLRLTISRTWCLFTVESKNVSFDIEHDTYMMDILHNKERTEIKIN